MDLCRQCYEWTPDPWAICGECRSKGFYNVQEGVAQKISLLIDSIDKDPVLSIIVEGLKSKEEMR